MGTKICCKVSWRGGGGEERVACIIWELVLAESFGCSRNSRGIFSILWARVSMVSQAIDALRIIADNYRQLAMLSVDQNQVRSNFGSIFWNKFVFYWLVKTP